MKLTLKIETDNYNKSIVIDEDDIKVFNNKRKMTKEEIANM